MHAYKITDTSIQEKGLNWLNWLDIGKSMYIAEKKRMYHKGLKIIQFSETESYFWGNKWFKKGLI